LKALVLAYHSHNIGGAGYGDNDHVAFASDLATLTEAGARIVPVTRIAEGLAAGRIDGNGETLVGLTFDDGPVFDFEDFVHPRFGPQKSFVNAMLDFRRANGAAQPYLAATSFVIASPAARLAMERAEECGYTFIEGWLADDWWQRAEASGMLAIGNHSWDHVHPVPESIATGSQERGDFARVDNYRDADREIRAASDFINSVTGGRCETFAFPFGHTNEYLVRDYLPKHRGEHGLVAAFGTGGRGVRADDSVWDIPRAVCGHHWKSPAELRELLLAA
jgi:peptidoglycan/xylan/chitin deacetylase (PgdA/CDA1 family)